MSEPDEIAPTPPAVHGRWTLAEVEAVALTPATALAAWGDTLVIAPHPDDESLGCGGVIAQLRRAGRRVEIAILTDGRGSHRHSAEYPTARLVELRRHEMHTAANALGVPSNCLKFFDLEESAMPATYMAAGKKALTALVEVMSTVETVLVPWRREPHEDYRAAYEYTIQAAAHCEVKVIEYPVWLWLKGAPEDGVPRAEFDVLRIDIRRGLDAKWLAIESHKSQTSDLIKDDHTGFTMPREMRQHCDQPWEVFFVPKHGWDPAARR